jgi:hypothetical protein
MGSCQHRGHSVSAAGAPAKHHRQGLRRGRRSTPKCCNRGCPHSLFRCQCSLKVHKMRKLPIVPGTRPTGAKWRSAGIQPGRGESHPTDGPLRLLTAYAPLPPGSELLHFLEQLTVAIRITERSKRAIVALPAAGPLAQDEYQFQHRHHVYPHSKFYDPFFHSRPMNRPPCPERTCRARAILRTRASSETNREK